MKTINDLKIGTRLNLVFNLTFVIIISVLGIFTIVSERKQITEDTDTRMFEQVNDLSDLIEEQVRQSQENANEALRVGDYITFRNARFGSAGTIPVQAINNQNSETHEVNLKAVSLNGTALYHNNAAVDQISKLTGASVSIFQKIPQGYMRIATSVLQKDGSRLLNTYIPAGSPVAQSLDRGENYQARNLVGDEWYLTAYKSYVLPDGTRLALGTGFKQNDMSRLRETFLSKKYFETGYPYLVNKEGLLTIHPNNEGTSIANDDFFRQIKEDADGYGHIEYEYEGKMKLQYFKEIKAIDSYVAVTIYRSEFMKIVRQVTYAMIGAIIAGILIFLVINMLISRSITSALKKGVEFARKIAAGDLTVNLNINQQDEIGDLASALSEMVTRLKQIVINIRDGAESIASASSQISNSSQQLSEGATEQASSTEEISSSMEEMASNIQQNTDNARQTESISSRAAESMLEMGKIGKESLDSMRTIAEKITIINDIAFQTNLLALNAAVEAARAGEHGRGFAVVAAEVRKLAERSKKAADEIEGLSKSSLKITEKTRESLETLLPEIQKTSTLVQEIASASLEQNQGSDQINSAIQQLNVVTQQNAAASEEMASSAEELSSQAESLKDAVAFFKTDQEKHDSHTLKSGKSEKKNIESRKLEMKKNAHLAGDMKVRDSSYSEFESF